ncbi:MAG: methionyl-tRNA formyltransferase [Bacteroidota bacterium]
MNIVFMGSPEFALPSLKILLENEYDMVGVVTAPDKPRGRGQAVTPTPVKAFALAQNLNILQPASLKEPAFIETVRKLRPHIAVVVAFRILPEELFTLPTHGSINLHASLLPCYRGAAPIQWAIMNGEKETGVTTFFLQEAVDKGNIILQARTRIGDEETAGEVHDRLSEIGAEIVLHTVRLIEQGKANPKPQAESLASPAPKIVKEDCRIDWSKDARAVHNFVRGLSPSPGAYTIHRDRVIKFHRTKLVDEETERQGGTIVKLDGELWVAARRGVVSIMELQQEGHKRLRFDEFLRGYQLKEGDRFG